MADANVTITPHLTCRNAVEALDFYEKAFCAKREHVMTMPDGRLMHGCMSIGGARFFMVEEFGEYGVKGPETLGGSGVSIHLHVPNCDEVFNRAVAAGCTVRMPLEDMFWGDRYGCLTDPYGHTWSVATTVRDVSLEEMQAAAAKMAAEGCPGAEG